MEVVLDSTRLCVMRMMMMQWFEGIKAIKRYIS